LNSVQSYIVPVTVPGTLVLLTSTLHGAFLGYTVLIEYLVLNDEKRSFSSVFVHRQWAILMRDGSAHFNGTVTQLVQADWA